MSVTPIHHTECNQIHVHGQEGYEFSCPQCGFRARYIDGSAGQGKFLVLDNGDPAVRHISLRTLEPRSTGWLEPLDDAAPLFEEEADYEDEWLTPELRRQIEAVLERAGDF